MERAPNGLGARFFIGEEVLQIQAIFRDIRVIFHFIQVILIHILVIFLHIQVILGNIRVFPIQMQKREDD